MNTSGYWITHFKNNALQKRINWSVAPNISSDDVNVILRSLQAWQLGETSEGIHLIKATEKYAMAIGDPGYLEAIKLFIKEEQKHGNNLGRYIDEIGKPRLQKDWGDTMFRKVRYFNTNMELWTLAVITVESTAQVFYMALKDATSCGLLKEICADILIDEADHITFQMQRLAMIFENKNSFSRKWRKPVYKLFFYLVSQLVWIAHGRLFKAGGFSYQSYSDEMIDKFNLTIGTIINMPMVAETAKI